MSHREIPRSPFPGRVERRGPLTVTVGEIRVVMRGPMFPTLARFPDGSLVITASAGEEHGPTTSIRSTDRGDTWKPFRSDLTERAGCNTIEMRDGTTVALSVYTKPIADEPGWYRTTRWESDDRGLTVRGPLED